MFGGFKQSIDYEANALTTATHRLAMCC